MNNLYKFVSIILISFAVVSYFAGFYFDESSVPAGTYQGDFNTAWNNLQIFLNYDLITSINHPDYHNSRAPIIYMIYEIFNPFIDNKLNFRKSVFVISTLLPVLFYFCLKQKFKKEENLVLILISSTIFLSPYFRTSAYWSLEENYGLIFLLLTFLSVNYFDLLTNKFHSKEYIGLFIITLLSSSCFYFDQKLIIIPIICFLKIITSEKIARYKIFTLLMYFIFSLPYIYFIFEWGSLIPTVAADARKLGNQLFLDHIGYTSTMIAFYLLPLLFFKDKKLTSQMKVFFSNKKNYYFILFFLIYLLFLTAFSNLNLEIIGKGYIHKISLIIFESQNYRLIFIYLAFFISWLIILFYFSLNAKDLLIMTYFFLLSVIIWPVFQEYFDPLIIIMAFTFFSSKLYLTYKNSIILFLYLSIFLIGTNIYYSGFLH